MLDLVLRGGSVVDGTGAPAQKADVGIRNGQVVEVGTDVATGAREVDVTGLIVVPGFVDIHTHYDAQIQWDPTLSPSALHGTTTVIGGNCGFTVAPMTANDASYILRMLANVEGMPLEALEAKLPMDWHSFGEWLDRLDGKSALNVGFLVGHSTIRRLVMGDAATERAATDSEIEEMKTLLAESIAAGGLGLSTSWSSAHTDGEKRPVPSRFATEDELVALAGVLKGTEGTLLEFVVGRDFAERETNTMIAMSLAADRPINWNVIRLDSDDDLPWAETRLANSDVAKARGAAIIGLTNPEPHQVRRSIATRSGFKDLPGWQDFMASPASEKLKALSDPEQRQILKASAAVGEMKGHSKPLRNWSGLVIDETFAPENKKYQGRTVGEVAAEQGIDPFDLVANLAVSDDLRTFFLLPETGNDKEIWERRIDSIRDPRTLLGGSDAGAHLSQSCGARHTTCLLAYGVRDFGLLPIEEAVHYLTDAPARFYGLRNRGPIQPGYWADLVVFDLDKVEPGPLHSVADLPQGASRLLSYPSGIERVFVNGTEIVTGGDYTGNLPGTLLRSTTGDLETVNLHSYVSL